MARRALIDVHFHNHITCCQFLDHQLTSRADMKIIFNYLNHRALTVKGLELILDFIHVNHVSSDFIGNLQDLHHVIQEHRGQLVLAQVNDPLFTVFDLLQLDEKFRIHRIHEHEDNPVDRIEQLCRESDQPHPTVMTRVMSMVHNMHWPAPTHHR